MASTQQPSIIVIGAGLGGLMLARVLQQRGVAVTVYEGDPTPDHRPQGGMLDISTKSGQWALREAGLFEEFSAGVKPRGELMRITDHLGHLTCDSMPEVEGEAPEMERGKLRSLLLNSLAPGTVVWGAAVAKVERAGDRQRVIFKSGVEIEADLVVGAEGTWSKVRPLLTSRKPKYSGITMIETRVYPEDATPAATALIDSGSLFMLGEHKVIFAHSGDCCWVGAGVQVPLAWLNSGEVNWQDVPSAKAYLLAQYANWEQTLRSFIADSAGPFIPRPVYAYPTGLRWRHQPGLTLIGDAAHVMGPFGGWGANLAMQDGAALGLSLAAALAAGGDWRQAQRTAEKAMFARTWRPAILTQLGMSAFFGPNAAEVTSLAFEPKQGLSAWAERLSRTTYGLAYLHMSRAEAQAKASIQSRLKSWVDNTSVKLMNED